MPPSSVPPLDPTGDGGADPPTAEPATAILARHIARLEKEIEELKQERDRAFDKASDRDSIAAQLRALRIALYELRDDRERWRCLAERLSALSTASRRWWWPWSRTGSALPAVADELASSRGAAIRAGLLPDNRHRRLTDEGDNSWASLPDQAGSPLDENAPDISTSGARAGAGTPRPRSRAEAATDTMSAADPVWFVLTSVGC